VSALITWVLLAVVLLALCFISWRSYIKLDSAAQDDPSGMIGLVGVAQDNFCEHGSVLARGELWQACSARGIVNKGDRVRIVGLESGLTLVVERLEG
jgi:membrane-bound ClpP family serine protease